MTRLDRHIARRYLVNIVALFAALFSFVIVVDVFLNLREFVEAAESLAAGPSQAEPQAGAPSDLVAWAQEGSAAEGAAGGAPAEGGLEGGLEGGAGDEAAPPASGGAAPAKPADVRMVRLVALSLLAVVDLWGPRLLQLFNYLTGVVLVAAMGFTCVGFVRRREFTAIIASGISLHRLAAPLLVVALGITALAAANQEFLLPGVAHLLPRSHAEAGRRSLESFRVPLVKDAEGRLFYAARYDSDNRALENLTVLERTESGAAARRIRAERAVWDGSGWTLEEGLAESDPGVKPQPLARIETDLDPTAILVSQIQGYGQSLSWRQIAHTLRRAGGVEPSLRERLDRVRFGRLSAMTCNLLAVVIALPFFLLREPRNMVAQSLKCAPLALAALLGSAIGSAAPLPGLPTWLGVFMPALALLPISIWALASIRT